MTGQVREQSPAALIWRGYTEIFGCTLIWAGFAVVAKLALTGTPPEVLASWRFALAAMFLVPWLWATGSLPRIPGKYEWPELLLLSSLGVIGHNLFLFFGLNWASAYECALVTNTLIPIAIPVIASLAGVETFDRSRIPGLVIGSAGVVLIFIGIPGGISGDSSRFWGVILFLGSGSCWSIYTVLSRRAHSRWKPSDLAAWSTWIGALVLLPLGLWKPLTQGWPDPSVSLWGKLGYMSILNTVIAFFMWQNGVARIGPARSGVMVYLVPVFTLMLSALVLAERPSALQLAGGGLAMGGVLWANRRELLGGWIR
ncbi:MAG: DMT family transporter [Deltaproteobacteria bacterium]|nr:DMT family transporter [Deltaproteobacteria bacterium]